MTGTGTRVASLHTYPIKACSVLHHDVAQVQPWGLAGDRRWLVIGPDGKAVTQRDCPAMVRIRPAWRPGVLTLRAAGRADLAVAEPTGPPVDITAFPKTPFAATLADPAAAEWLSDELGRPVRLVWQDDPTRRPVPFEYAPTDRVSFADAFAVTLANTASLAALNGWLAEAGSPEGPLPMNRFRPNVVITGAAAWAEDGWTGRRLRIGAVTFRVPQPVDRCVVTTTDQQTGERGKEPLRTLARYRKVNQDLLFATNLVPEATGSIAVGDPVEPLDGAEPV
ncbi:MAG TPA: MOSC N-terminal beta barrel domain-containing protein [Pilimelia sp.]|nr:MOSC N-terminal beta barrel domain-containing protein [Pilimelia sp.]